METISKKNILAKLHALKPDLVVKYKVKSLELFGSVAREESHPNSDIDLLVQFAEDADMFDLVGLSSFLEERLHRKVDVVSKRALRQELKSAVLSEAITI